MLERQLGIARCGALGEYGHIWEIFVYMFKFISSWLACTHELLYRTYIIVAESV